MKVRGRHQHMTEFQSANLTVSKVLEAVETLDHKLNSTIALYQEGFNPPQLQSANFSTGRSSTMTSEPSTLIMMELLQLMWDVQQDEKTR